MKQKLWFFENRSHFDAFLGALLWNLQFFTTFPLENGGDQNREICLHVLSHNFSSRGARKVYIPSFSAPYLAWHIPGVQARPTWFADTRHIRLHLTPKMAILLHFFSSGCASWVHILFGGVRAPKGPEGSIMCAKTSLNFLRHSNPKILHFEVRKIPPFLSPPP